MANLSEVYLFNLNLTFISERCLKKRAKLHMVVGSLTVQIFYKIATI